MNRSLFRTFSRRDFVRRAAACAIAPCLSGWLGALAARAQSTPAAAGRTPKRCILLWMNGGPSQADTFDLKPDSRGPSQFRPIATAVPGVQICEHLPRLARLMREAVLIRGMSTPEGDHRRAQYHLHTGYREGAGGVAYPSLGSIASAELGRDDFPLPNFVAINHRTAFGAGFLGPLHQPLLVSDPRRGVDNLQAPVAAEQFRTQLSILDELEASFFGSYPAPAARAHQTNYQRAVRLMRAPQARAFDLSEETPAVRSAYGIGAPAAPGRDRILRGGGASASSFAESCLLARRLVEVGVPFVEVTLDGWDTHRDNFPRTRALCEQMDQPIAALISDLRDRGLLDDTLGVWMGEFGRTPQITGGDGRNHYPQAWSTLLFGGGIRGGQVIGRTDAQGVRVEERPVSAADFLATVCRILGIDYTRRNLAPGGRPIRIVDAEATPLADI